MKPIARHTTALLHPDLSPSVRGQISPARRATLLLLLLAAWTLRLLHLDARPLWVDEAFSLWIAHLPLSELIAKVRQIDQHPPLYYLALKVWSTLLGPSEWSLRSLSAFWGMLTVPLAYVTARRVLGDARAALVSAALVAFSPFHIRYAQEARMYTMLAFWGLLALYASVTLSTSSWRAPLLGVSVALAALSHSVGLLLLPTVAFTLLLIRPPRRSVFLAGVAFTLVWVTWLPAFLHQAMGVVRRFWIPWPTWRDVLEAIRTFHAAYTPFPAWARWGVDVLFLSLVALGARRHPSARPLLAFWLLPLLIELALSPLRPIFQTRTLIWATFAYYTLVTAGVRALRRARSYLLAPTLVLGILLIQVLGIREWYVTAPPERWDQAVSIVQGYAQPDDLLLFNAAWTEIPFSYYAARANLHLEAHGVPVDIATATELEPLTTPADAARIASLTRGRARVWLIYSHEWYTDPNRVTRRALERDFVLIASWQVPGIRIFLFQRREIAWEGARPGPVPTPQVSRKVSG